MNKLRFLTFCLLLVARLAAALDGNEIVRRADDGRMPPGSIVFKCTVKDYEDGKSTRETKFLVYNKGHDKSLVETVFPERQKGRKLLMDNDNLWFFTPDIKRPARVSMQQRLTGEVANGDLARTNFSGDYEAKAVGKEKIRGQETHKLSLSANRKGVTYAQIDYWVTVKDHIPVRALFYAVSGKMLKTAEYTSVKKVLGRNVVTKTVFTDALNPQRQSVLLYSGHRREDIPESLFSKDGLSE